jgi:hypothetical protein
MDNLPTADDFDCGDGVPHLPLLLAQDRPDEDDVPTTPTPSAAAVVIGLVLAGQLVLLLAVLAGGDPLIGAAAGLALLVCGGTMLVVRAALGTSEADADARQATVEVG